ncbi:MAG: hypothetical protein NXI32_22225 [bacterium]|nr:hypothetical protein [bacterium]
MTIALCILIGFLLWAVSYRDNQIRAIKEELGLDDDADLRAVKAVIRELKQ